MARFELLRDVSAGVAGIGASVAAGAFVVEVLGFDSSEPPPEIFNWIEGSGCVILALGVLGLGAYKALNPSSPNDDQRDHWRNGY